MKKKKYLIPILVVAVVFAGVLIAVFAGGKNDGPLSTNEIKNVVLDDLGVKENKAGEIHTHPTTFEGAACYTVYITADGKNWEYMIDAFTGEILSKTENDHSHSH
ncbi:MAG: hypothetical protein E7461_06680 [Ruminococcaceae bacterium]|nr:hypothetical protein [Oscillospiraceae bacterium]